MLQLGKVRRIGRMIARPGYKIREAFVGYYPNQKSVDNFQRISGMRHLSEQIVPALILRRKGGTLIFTNEHPRGKRLRS